MDSSSKPIATARQIAISIYPFARKPAFIADVLILSSISYMIPYKLIEYASCESCFFDSSAIKLKADLCSSSRQAR